MRYLMTSLLLLISSSIGCESAVQPGSTSGLAATGVLEVRGRVIGVNGAPLDSFRVFANVNTDSIRAIYEVLTGAVTGPDGTVEIRIKRYYFSTAPDAPGSVPLRIAAESMRARDRNRDGSPRRIDIQRWVKFAKPPLAPGTLTVDLAVPNIR